jgi:uncharacterized membrane protein
MKGKGVIVILFFLVVFPFFTDLILVIVTNGKGIANFGMSEAMLFYYLIAIPFYICYLIIAYTIMYIGKKLRDRKESQTEINE